MLQREYHSGIDHIRFEEQNYSTMTAPRYEAFRARCLLAALDHNHHTTDEHVHHKTTKELRFHRKYNKASGQFTVARIRPNKTYDYIPELLTRVLTRRISEKANVNDPTKISDKHPAHIAPTIAPLPPPPTAELANKQHSRTGKITNHVCVCLCVHQSVKS